MRTRRGLLVIQILVSLLSALTTPALAAAGGAFYVSLGTSLSVGIQPTPSGENHPTPDGYADQLFEALRTTTPGLKLHKLGCPGETSITMVFGGICAYEQGSQLAQAVTFLQAHSGSIALITIDVGANDVEPCASLSGAAQGACIGQALGNIGFSLAHSILPALTGAAPGVPIIGMNYYNPFVVVSPASTTLQILLNDFTLAPVYGAFGVPVADVAAAFDSYNTTPDPVTGYPTNVQRICDWTWMCVPPPQGPNIHANAEGYGEIAQAFVAVWNSLP
jgi:lysophospholipase L1-like esterase